MSNQGTLQIATLSDTGCVRDHNEDYIDADAQLGIAVLADGMGGYQAGEIASEIAVTQIMQELHSKVADLQLEAVDQASNYRHASLLLQQAVLKANQAIYQSAQAQPEFHGMGTTIVATLFYANYLSVAHVGDSRLYRLRDKQLEQVTTDHSVLQELIEHGFYTREQARHSPNKNLVTRALGVNMEVKVDLTEQQVNADDIYLLCSDGLNDMLEDQHIETLLCAKEPLEKIASHLVAAANAAGGDDNISVILIKSLQPSTTGKTPWWQRWWPAWHKKSSGKTDAKN